MIGFPPPLLKKQIWSYLLQRQAFNLLFFLILFIVLYNALA